MKSTFSNWKIAAICFVMGLIAAMVLIGLSGLWWKEASTAILKPNQQSNDSPQTLSSNPDEVNSAQSPPGTMVDNMPSDNAASKEADLSAQLDSPSNSLPNKTGVNINKVKSPLKLDGGMGSSYNASLPNPSKKKSTIISRLRETIYQGRWPLAKELNESEFLKSYCPVDRKSGAKDKKAKAFFIDQKTWTNRKLAEIPLVERFHWGCVGLVRILKRDYANTVQNWDRVEELLSAGSRGLADRKEMLRLAQNARKLSP